MVKKNLDLQSGVEGTGDLSNVSRVLSQTKKAVVSGDFNKLGHLSNATIHSATVNQDSLNIIVAVLIYSIQKVMNRHGYSQMKGWDVFYDGLMKNLDVMIGAAESNDSEGVVHGAGEIRQVLNEIEGDLGVYIKDVFRKAEINKAFKIYEHGISSQKTADLLGVSLWDLSSYIGQSNISESRAVDSMPEDERIKNALEFFG